LATAPVFGFGFEVDDVGVILEKLKEKYPKVLVTKGLEQVAFAVFRSHDPAGTQFDISWKQHPKVQEGYKDDGWKQPRQINHIAIRSAEPERVAEFYHEVFDLKEGKNFYDEDALSVTDGTVDLVIRRTSNHSYMSMREGIDHFGYAVESIEDVKKDLDEFGRANPGGDLARLRVAPDAVHCHGETVRGQPARDDAAQAAGTARHESHPSSHLRHALIMAGRAGFLAVCRQ